MSGVLGPALPHGAQPGAEAGPRQATAGPGHGAGRKALVQAGHDAGYNTVALTSVSVSQGSVYNVTLGTYPSDVRFISCIIQCCGSGSESGRIRIILTDPDRDRLPEHDDPDPISIDRYQSQAYEKVDKLAILFSQKFQCAVQNP